MSTSDEVVLRTAVVQDDEEEELAIGTVPRLQSSTSAPLNHGGPMVPSSPHNETPRKENHDGDGDDDDDEFALEIAYVPRSQRGKEKEATGFFSSTSSRTAAFSSTVHIKSSAAPQNDGTVALDAYPSGFPDDTDKPNDVEEWKHWQARQAARTQLPQFVLFQQ